MQNFFSPLHRMECALCQARAAKVRAAHGGVELPFCGAACSEAFCGIARTLLVGPKNPAGASDSGPSKRQRGDSRDAVMEERVEAIVKRAESAGDALQSIDPRLWDALPVDVRLQILGQTRLVPFYATLSASKALRALVKGDAARRLAVYRSLIARIARVYGCTPSVVLLDRPEEQLKAILGTRDVVITERSLPTEGTAMLGELTGPPLAPEVAALPLVSGVLPFKSARLCEFTLVFVLGERGDLDYSTARLLGAANFRRSIQRRIHDGIRARFVRSLRFEPPRNNDFDGLYRLKDPDGFLASTSDEAACELARNLDTSDMPELYIAWSEQSEPHIADYGSSNPGLAEEFARFMEVPHSLILARRNAIAGPVYQPRRQHREDRWRVSLRSKSQGGIWSRPVFEVAGDVDYLALRGYYIDALVIRVFEPPGGALQREYGGPFTRVDPRLKKETLRYHEERMQSFSRATWTERNPLHLRMPVELPDDEKAALRPLTVHVSYAVTVMEAYPSMRGVNYTASVLNDGARVSAERARVYRHDPFKPLDQQDGVRLAGRFLPTPTLLSVNTKLRVAMTREALAAELPALAPVISEFGEPNAFITFETHDDELLETLLFTIDDDGELAEVAFDARTPATIEWAGRPITSDVLVVKRGQTAIASRLE